jgi:spore photoproduct lyase
MFSHLLYKLDPEWHPKAEELLWRPEIQENKISGTGGRNLRYKVSLKRGYVQSFRELLEREMPYCRIRYAF